jgi:methyltransferase (TIGR00027 family)
MQTLPVKHVSHTAWLVAAFRAQESERIDAHFHDKLANKLLGDLEQSYLGRFSDDVRTDNWILTVRTCQIDQLILNSIQEGVRTVLNLGAGLDTRPYRLNLPKDLSSPVTWFEADFKDLIEYKNGKLKNEVPHCPLIRIAADLSQSSERLRVLDILEQQPGPALVLTEGLLGYLSEENVKELAKDLISTANCKYWLMDVFNRSFLESARKFWHFDATEREADDVQLGFVPEDTALFLRPFGWELQEFRSFGEGAIQYNRLPRNSDVDKVRADVAFQKSGVCLLKSKEYV